MVLAPAIVTSHFVTPSHAIPRDVTPLPLSFSWLNPPLHTPPRNRFRSHVHVKVHIRVNNLTEPSEPLTQSIHRGWRWQNGANVWDVDGMWVRKKGGLEQDMWFKNAKTLVLRKYGSVYGLLRWMSVMPGLFYLNVNTQMFPYGALRGQLVPMVPCFSPL
ncbi:hypothetical protein CLOM_g23873 [Closterium sp. NIES-68]|nr:hypothetical protein CLOM_g23873 [Closterium sp. NIES-68]